MAQVQNTFNGGTNGATVNEANSGSASGTAFDFVEILTGATGVYSTSAAMHGSLGMNITGNGAHAFVQHNMAGTKTLTARFYVRFPSAPTATCQLYTPRSSINYIGGLNIRSDLKFQVAVNGGAGIFNSAVLSTATWYRVEMAFEVGTSATTGKIWFKYFVGNGTTAVETFTTTTADLGTNDIIMYRLGKINNTGSTPMDIDSITFDPASTAFLGPHTDLNIPPVANAGTGGNDIEPGTTLTLNGSASTDPNGSIASYVWTQTSGQPVTITGTGHTRTVMAPYTISGTVLGFRLTVTDNQGATSSASVAFLVLPASERIAVGGVWAPAALRSL